MTPQELLRMLLQAPELSMVGSSQERAAFIALRIDCRTVRDAGEAIGISKSNVQNLADLF
jgi:DNA-directed RNA polymerase specialized sigma24 family protein